MRAGKIAYGNFPALIFYMTEIVWHLLTSTSLI